MPLTPAAIKAAFQDAMPNRHDDFVKRVKTLRNDLLRHDPHLSRYPAALLDLAETELRDRIRLAATRVKQLIDSGWTADQQDTVRNAFLNCFALADGMDKDPQQDLYRYVDSAHSFIGAPDDVQTTRNVRRLSRVQVNTATECLSDLEVYYAVNHPGTPTSSPEADKTAVLENVSRFTEAQEKRERAAFLNLLHPKIAEASIRHYEDGDYRESVLNAMLALTEIIRAKIKKDGDGIALASILFKPEKPILVFSKRTTQAERDDQEGFHKLMLGAFQGIRNPKSHQMASDLTEMTAAQYIVFISLLARRVDEAELSEH
jgi:uncharacterized protein (TIGR02391 family)